MTYWLALKFLAKHCVLGMPTPVSLQHMSEALACTKRNVQLVIKRLVAEEIILWQAGVGRGRYPSVTLLKDVHALLEKQAYCWLESNKVSQALMLVEDQQKSQLLSQYMARYQTEIHSQDILQVPFYRGTHELDAIGITRRTEQHIASYLYATLLKWDVKLGQLVGDIAHSWTQQGDTLTVTLRKALRFHDGSALLAGDVAAHFQRLLKSDSANAQLYRFIDRFDVVDDYTLQIQSVKMAPLLTKLISKEPMGISKLTAEKVLGSGPFELVEQTEWCTRLAVFSGYHGHRPWVDGVDIWNIGDRAKQFELHSDIYNLQYQHLSGQSSAALHQQWEKGAEYLLINANRRHWLEESANRNTLVKALLALGLPAKLVAQDVAGAESMAGQPGAFAKVDIERAKALIDVLPKPDEPLLILTYQLHQHIELAQYYANMLTKLGLPCRYQVEEFPTFERTEIQQQADIIISGEVLSDDIELSLLSWLMSSTALDSCLLPKQKQALQAKVFNAISADNEQERIAKLQGCERQLQQDSLYAPLFHVKQHLHFSSRVSVSELLANGWIDFCDVVIKRGT